MSAGHMAIGQMSVGQMGKGESTLAYYEHLKIMNVIFYNSGLRVDGL